MAKGAPLGNDFWNRRSRHGRKKLFASPTLMWKAAAEYFAWCDENPLIEAVVQKRKISRDEEIIELVDCPKKRPYTWQALCLYMDCWTGYFWEFEQGLKGKNDETSKDFSNVITRIRETIFNQKFEGAASGFFNANIIARDLGLKDSKDITSAGESIKPKFDLDKLTHEELESLAKLQMKLSAEGESAT